MTNSELKVLMVLLAIAGLAVAVWYYQDEILPQEKAPIIAIPFSEVEEEQASPEPLHPIEAVADPVTTEIEELPPLDDSDTSFLATIVDTLGAEIENLLASDALIDRFVASIDNLPRKHIPEKIRPAGRLPTEFVAAGTADDRYYALGSENFQRYDAMVNVIAGIDIDSAVAVYRRYYPLFQESYQRLGYPDAYFNDRVIEVIDHLLSTPEPPQALQLVRPHVLYEFANPELEALSSGQKLLLRIGVENSMQVKSVLRDLRTRLVVDQATGL